MIVFRELKIISKGAKRLGAFVRAREKGLSAEDARAYSDQLYPPTVDDAAYEEGLRANKGVWFAARYASRFTRLIKELGATYTQGQVTADTLAPTSGKRGRTDALEELTALAARHERVAAVLEQHGYAGPAGKAKLVELHWELLAGGAGLWVGQTYIPAAAFYDPRLLALLLKARADGKNPAVVAILAFDYCAGTSLMKLAQDNKVANPEISTLLLLDHMAKKKILS